MLTSLHIQDFFFFLICGTYIHTCRNKNIFIYIYTRILEVNLFVLYTNVNITKGKGESSLLGHLYYKVIIYLFFFLLFGRGGLDSPLSLFLGFDGLLKGEV